MPLLAGTNVWTASGPAGAFVRNVSTDPTDRDVAFVQTPAGIYRTTDGGAKWQPVNDGLSDDDSGTLSIDGFADTSTRWLMYGSSIDRTTGQAQMFWVSEPQKG